MKGFHPVILFIISFVLTTCMNGRRETSLSDAPPSAPAPYDMSKTIFIQVSVLWEGIAIKDFNIEAIRNLKNKFPQLSFKHFISPAYFTREGADELEITNLIKSAIAENDSVGLYLQPWKSLTAKAGVEFKPHLTFWGESANPTMCARDCGGDMPLNTYSESDIEKLVTYSLDVFKKQGFPKTDGFFAAGWMTTPEIYNVLAKHGLDDYSQVPPSVVYKRLSPFPLYGWLVRDSSQVSPLSLPHSIPTASGNVLGIGNSAGVVDYQTIEDTDRLFDDFIAQRSANALKKPLIFHIGIHQESAQQYSYLLEKMIESIYVKSAQASVELVPLDPAIFRSQDLVSHL
ncbi:MAG: hypothetical protein AB7T49_08265 [Oligoflexales bacterium]